MLGIFAHDPGGAEVVSSWLKFSNAPFKACLGGAAVEVFLKRFPNISLLPASELLDTCDSLLCGTSRQSEMELEAIKIAKTMNKQTVAYLDHWSNYPQRFVFKDGERCYPNKIWVGDEYALALANLSFPKMQVEFVQNQFFEEIKRAQIRHVSFFDNASRDDQPLRVLFVGEGLTEHKLSQFSDSNHFGYDEFRAFSYFLDNMDCLNLPIKEITIRPHPLEALNKYEKLVGCSSIKVKVNNKCDILEHIFSSDVVVGCQSMAMVLGLIAGKVVISAIPPEGAATLLPHKSIINLRELTNGS